MEAIKKDQNGGAQSKLKVVKVVKLNRFMPKTDASSIFKRKISLNHFSSVHTEDVDKNEVLGDLLVNRELELNETGQEKSSNLEDSSNSCKVKSDSQKCKIKFRSCSHTAEELTKLTEHSDETLVKIGDTFETREAFRKYLNDNAKRWFYYYVCRTSKKNVLEYNCICMAYTLKPKNIIIRKQKRRTTACPCKIRLALDEETKKFIVYYACHHHDHDLTEAAFYHYPHAKYLPQDMKDIFLDLAYLGLDIDLIQKYIHSVAGLTIKRKDISSYAYKFKRKTIQRNLTPERRVYIKRLIAKIRDTYKQTTNVTIRRISDEDCQILHVTPSNKPKRPRRRISRKNSKEGRNSSLDTANDAHDTHNKPVDNVLDKVLDPGGDDENYDVIVQYINEDGILCDQNGAPVTNSSAIMQFINNYEYVMPETNVNDRLLEVGTVFSDLVENIGDDIYPLDWDVEIDPIERDDAEATNVETTGDAGVGADVGATDTRSEEMKECSPQMQSVEAFERLSPTRETPAVYAEMDNFKKYYFVDHRYIKYEDEDEEINVEKRKLHMERMKRRERMAKWAKAHGEEYIKAPDFASYPSHLRHCSGHEDLTLLSDPDAIQSGAKFLTHDVFLRHVNERASRWFFYYSLVESGRTPEFYVYKCVYGKNRTSRNAYRAKGIRKRSKLATECPCQIRLRRLHADPAYLTVLYSCNHHDHAPDAQQFKALPHSRRLPHHIKEEVKDLLCLGAKYDVLRKYVTSETGLRVYGKYFHNVRVKMARKEETRQFPEERLKALTQKLKDLEAMYCSASKENPRYPLQYQGDTSRPSPLKVQMEDRSVQVGFDEDAKETKDSSSAQASKNHSRLETRLHNLSSHKETLLKVKKLQESARSDHLRNTYEVVQYSSVA